MLDLVQTIIKAIDEKQPIPDCEGAWLKQGFVRCMQKGELLHHALNLSGLKYQYLLSARNKHLYGAWCLTDESLSDWRRAGEVILRIERFKHGRWLNIQFDYDPPSNLSAINTCLFYALKTNSKMPTTTRQVHSVVKSMSKVNFSDPLL